jgi:hypothetical protein
VYGSDDDLVERFAMPVEEARVVVRWRDFLSLTCLLTPVVGWVIFTPITYFVATGTLRYIGVALETALAIFLLILPVVLLLVPRRRAAQLILERAGESGNPDYLRTQFDATTD